MLPGSAVVQQCSLKQAISTGLFLFLVACLPQSASAEELSSFLKGISSADHQLSYQGVFVLRKSDRMMSMQVSHAADDKGVRENMLSLNGETRQVIRNNDKVLTIYPDRDYVIVSEGKFKTELHPTLPESLDKLRAFYNIERLGDDRIANHKTAVIKLHPRDDFRYGYQYWVDAETGVLLRCDMFDGDDNIIEQMMFTQLVYKDELPASYFEFPGLADLQTHRLGANRVAAGDTGWDVAELPAGFMLTQSTLRNKQDDESLHLVYSDGLASVSIFIERGKSNSHYLSGATSMGALNAYGAKKDDVYITVMGEVPANTVEIIAMSTAPSNLVRD